MRTNTSSMNAYPQLDRYGTARRYRRKRTLSQREMLMWKEYTFPALRLMRGHTTAAVSRECGLSWGTVNRLRKLETVAPRMETIMKILKTYGAKITVEYPDD